MFGVFGEARIGLKPLAALCRRLATSLAAGVDVRTVWARETLAARGSAKRVMDEISQNVSGGAGMAESIKASGRYFPPFFRELVTVGEESGHLPEVFRQLAEHYDHLLRMRRNLLGALVWPAIELAGALFVVGLLIWIMGNIPQLRQNNIDILGFGLTGNDGLMAYIGIIAAVAAGFFVAYRAASRGMLWIAPIQRAIMKIPQLGRALETLSMARLSWAMHVTLNSGMDLRRAMDM